MPTLLLPGRQVVMTNFQERYLLSHLQRGTVDLALVGGKRPEGVFDRIVFAITSANQSHSRYNPVPLEVRAIAVDRFARRLRDALGISYRIVPIPHFPPSPRFAQILLKEIAAATEDSLRLTRNDTAVFSSTPGIIEQFIGLGFSVLTGELESLESPPRYTAQTPNEVLKLCVAAGEKWRSAAEVRELLSPATFSVWQDFPDVPTRILRLYRDPLLTESGSLTETRTYSTYASAMSNPAILELKYKDIQHAIVPGKIVDEGCADGALLVPIARDFPDSDLIGIEITGEFLARCLERQRAMEFGGTYIHFHQRNITEPIFAADSIDTTICNSTPHELWSYGGQAATLRGYLREKFRQTRRRGRIIIRDVVGPADGGEEVYLWCNDSDGENVDVQARFEKAGELQRHLDALSTAGRFERFAADYLADQIGAGRRRPEDRIRFRRERVGEREYYVLPLHQAMEFLLKKDYTDNWRSELNEEFCFWDFGQWKRELSEAGFRVVENPNAPAEGSRAYTSEWIVRTRLKGKCGVYRLAGGELAWVEWPPTNMILVGEKG